MQINHIEKHTQIFTWRCQPRVCRTRKFERIDRHGTYLEREAGKHRSGAVC